MIAALISALHITAFSIFDWEPQKMRCTCYVATGSKTASGCYPYEGILASNREHLGKTALLYTLDYQYIGVFESKDIGGNVKLINGTAVDIYRDSMARAYEWVGEYGDYVYVIWLDAEG